MNVKTWLKQIKPKAKKGDLIEIYALETLPNGDKLNQYVNVPKDLERYPLLNMADILESNEELAPYTNGINGPTGYLKIFSARIDLEQYRIAKGLEPLKKSETRPIRKRKKKRFTL